MQKYALAVGASVVIFVLVLVFGPFALSRLIFNEHLEHKNFSVHSDEPISPAIIGILDSVDANLRRSEFYFDRRKHFIYISSNYFNYSIFSPASHSAFAHTNPFRTFVSKTSIDSNTVTRRGAENNKRSLIGVLSHELTHCLIWYKSGFFHSRILPKWKVEGYCDYIAKESSFNFTEGMRLVFAKEQDASASFFYFTAHLCIKYLIEERGMLYSEILSERVKQDDVLAEIVAKRYYPDWYW